jgi:chemotaxis signal transduction protein
VADVDPRRLGLFYSRHGNIALPAEKLIQVLDQPRLYGAPCLPDYVLGLVQFQTEVLPVLQCGNQASGLVVEAYYVAVCGSSLGLVGFGCDQVRQIADWESGRYEELTEPDCCGAVGRFFHQTETYTVIDVDLLVECLPE